MPMRARHTSGRRSARCVFACVQGRPLLQLVVLLLLLVIVARWLLALFPRFRTVHWPWAPQVSKLVRGSSAATPTNLYVIGGEMCSHELSCEARELTWRATLPSYAPVFILSRA
eukprot:COSAG02_NODE_1729_length_11180_cov_3.283368_1_plen_113_part_10